MSRPTAISPEEQEQIARRIGVLLLQEAPEDWQQVAVEYRATGDYRDLLAEVTLQDGDSRPWEPPEELNEIFEHLREGMYRPDVGTWLSALYTVERPSSYRIDINFDEEPRWQQPPPAEAYAEELRRYPRSTDNIPEWMNARLGEMRPDSGPENEHQQPASDGEAAHSTPSEPVFAEEPPVHPRLTTARVFDDVDEGGRPLVRGRPPLSPQESEPLRRYLESAPMVLSTENGLADKLDPSRPDAVPNTWHSDGSWVWPAAVPYYLAQYGMPPQPELVQHVRAAGFAVADLDPEVFEAATETARAAEAAERAEGVPESFRETAGGHEDEHAEAVTTTMAAAAEPPASRFDEAPLESQPPEQVGEPAPPEESTVDDTVVDPALPEESDTSSSEPPVTERSSPQAEPRSSGEAGAASRHGRRDEPEEDSELIFAQLRDRLGELGVPASEYGLGVRSEEVWSLFQEGTEWIVTAPGDDETLSFTRPDQACAYLLGSLLLTEAEETTAPGGSPGAELPSTRTDPEAAADTEPSEEPTRDTAPSTGDGAPEPSPLPAEEDLRPGTREDTVTGPDSGGNFLFTATEARPEEPDSSGREDAARSAAPSEDDAPTASPTTSGPEESADAAVTTPPPGQMPPPLPKRQPRPEQGGPAEQPERPAPSEGPVGPQPPAAAQPPAGGEGQPPGGVPPTPPPGAVPPPQARPMPPNAPGAPQPGQPTPAPVPPSAPNGQSPGGQSPGAPAAPPPRTAGDQPIQPLRGEPPLTLYRNRQTMVLQPGAELDRFGEPDGNVMYAIRTPYNQRSLPPQWASRNYFAYRVQRPVQVLGGTAVPWFEQPGGGTAYVLPASVNELLADGTLVALSGNEAARPPME